MNNMNATPIMGNIPNNSNDCEEMESPIFLTHAEASAMFNAIGFCTTTIKAMQCVIQEPVVAVLSDEEMAVYSDIRKKLFAFLGGV